MADNNKFKPVYPYTIDVNAQNVQYLKALMHGELPEQKKQVLLVFCRFQKILEFQYLKHPTQF